MIPTFLTRAKINVKAEQNAPIKEESVECQ